MSLDAVHDWVVHRNRDHYNVVACQGNEPTDADIAAFEADCGFRLPDDFREFTMSPLGGLYVEAKEELWPRAELYAVGPFWTFLYGLKLFGIASDIPDWLDLRVQYAQMRDEGFAGLVPFLQVVGDANKYCFTPRGEIVHHDHEQVDELTPLNESFSDVLARELRALDERVERRLRGEHRG